MTVPVGLRVGQVLATVAAAIGANLASWWLIGDQSTMGPRLLTHRPPLLRMESRPELEAVNARYSADFAWQPLDISLEAERTIGLVGLAVLVIGLVVLVATRRTFQGGWWWVIAALAVLSIAMAWSHRVLTAGVSGANIGGGLILLVGTPTLIVVLVALATFAHRLLARPFPHLPLPPDP